MPLDVASDSPELSLLESCLGLETQQLLLEIGREVQQTHDLTDASARKMGKARQLSTIADDATPEQHVTADRERHQARHPRYALRFLPTRSYPLRV
jgi:hypothetical protein